jgi:hypothetical protein
MMNRNRTRTAGVVLTALALVVAAETVKAAGGVIKIRGRRPQRCGNLVYSRATRKYTASINGVPVPFPANQVEWARRQRPANFADAVRTGNISLLEKIARQEEGFETEIDAYVRLLPLYLDSGRVRDAESVCSKITQRYGRIPPKLSRYYWDTLLRNNKTAELEKELREAIAGGNAEMAAAAYLVRGDMLKRQGDHRGALIRGYLRTVILYERIEQHRQEAVQKAAESLAAIRHPRAESFRKKYVDRMPN